MKEGLDSIAKSHELYKLHLASGSLNEKNLHSGELLQCPEQAETSEFLFCFTVSILSFSESPQVVATFLVSTVYPSGTDSIEILNTLDILELETAF